MEIEKINKITNILEKYHFEYLDKDDKENELIVEYTGDDVIFKEEDDFENYNDWIKFKNNQEEIIQREFEKAINEIKKDIHIQNYVYYYDEYVCVSIYL